jgi:hypothetical protein
MLTMILVDLLRFCLAFLDVRFPGRGRGRTIPSVLERADGDGSVADNAG